MVERKYTDPVDGPNLDEHPELEAEEDVEEEKPRRTRRRRAEPAASVTTADAPVDDPDHAAWDPERGGVHHPDAPPPEDDWASRTDKSATFRRDDV